MVGDKIEHIYCNLTNPSKLPLTIGGDEWASIPEHLVMYTVVTCISLLTYFLYRCAEARNSSSVTNSKSDVPSLLSLVRGKADKWLRKERGNAALQYIQFHRMLLFMGLVIFVISTVSLIINLTGKQSNKKHYFYRTTITNLSDNSDFHYLNIIAAFLLPWLVVVVVVKKFMVVRVREVCHYCEGSSTLVLDGVNLFSKLPSDSVLMEYFSINYPKFQLLKITRVQDTRHLRRLMRKLSWTINIIEQVGNGETESLGATCCCKDHSLKALELVELELKTKIAKEQNRLKSSDEFLDIVFLSLRSTKQAEQIVKMEEMDFFSNYNTIDQAPCPHEMIWNNMRSPLVSFLIKLLNFFLILIVTFVATSPAAFSLRVTSKIKEQVPLVDTLGYLTSIIPATLFLLFGLLMPNVVRICSVYYGHWSMPTVISDYMIRLFFWLLMTIVVFPLLMLNNLFSTLKLISNLPLIKSLPDFEHLEDKSEAKKEEFFNCLFIPTSGAFFVNYLILSALFRNQMQLHRLGDRFYEWWMVLTSCCSRVGMKVARLYAKNYSFNRNTFNNMALAEDYVWCTIQFAILSCFCLICPVVASIFLLYIIIKHLVDLQNFRVCYSAKLEQPMLIRTAAQLMMFCPLLGQLCNAVVHLTNNNKKETSPLALTAGSLAILNIFLMLFLQSTGWEFPISVFGDEKKTKKRFFRGEVYEDPAMKMYEDPAISLVL